MALYIPHSIFHLARLLYVRPETFGPYYVILRINSDFFPPNYINSLVFFMNVPNVLKVEAEYLYSIVNMNVHL